jgi:pullulanase
MKREIRIAHAILETPTSGVVELVADWPGAGKPPLRMERKTAKILSVAKLPDYRYGWESGYWVNKKGELFFLLPAEIPERAGRADEPIYVGGSFNGWADATASSEWQMKRTTLAGEDVYLWSGSLERFVGERKHQFKFVTRDHRWLEVPMEAPNAAGDGHGNRNFSLDLARTGFHRFEFTLAEPLDLSENHHVAMTTAHGTQRVTIRPGAFFFDLRDDGPLGALVQGGETVFRLFAPRARWVRVGWFLQLDQPEQVEWVKMERSEQGVWEATIPQALHGAYYWYRLDGPHNEFGAFDLHRNILDPYALAAVGREGPGIVLDRERMRRPRSLFRAPQWQDLVVVEAHVRDLTAQAPVAMTDEEQRGYTGLKRWVESRHSYLRRLGVNAVELQPLHENDGQSAEEYHWGYMTVNFFAPQSSYGLNPESASQVRELQELVEAFHRQGMAVILDVVFNHVGEPAHLMFIDKLYYFETGPDGRLSNWSGCGNDTRCRSAMMRRLIIDSLLHYMDFYGVDGFRFDLAELIGKDALVEIEKAIKAARPDAILIAEPWSFRGHIAGDLRDTGYSSWNDGYRNFMRDYLHGRGSLDGALYFLKGSPGHFARWPAQTVNYVESHDDRTWIDMITENPGHNGEDPTINDLRRTHLMAAVLMTSLGVPMLHAGQDFLVSKGGANNTYLRGDINALPYRRLYRYPATHDYFAAWIRFRRSDWGSLVRHFTRPADSFFAECHAEGTAALALVYNADGSRGVRRLLFAVNPHQYEVNIPMAGWHRLAWLQVADHERFFAPGSAELTLPVNEALYLPPLGCGLWVCEN